MLFGGNVLDLVYIGAVGVAGAAAIVVAVDSITENTQRFFLCLNVTYSCTNTRQELMKTGCMYWKKVLLFSE